MKILAAQISVSVDMLAMTTCDIKEALKRELKQRLWTTFNSELDDAKKVTIIEFDKFWDYFTELISYYEPATHVWKLRASMAVPENYELFEMKGSTNE